MAKIRVLPPGSAEKPNLPVRYLFLSVNDCACLTHQSVIQLCPRASLSLDSAENKPWSFITALASRCAQLTAGPFGPFDKVVNTLGS